MNRFLPSKLSLIALVASICALIVALNAGSNKTPNLAPSPDSLTHVLSTKQIRAAILIYPPTVDIDKQSGKASGFLIDIMNEIARRAGLSITYEPTTFDDLKAAVTSSRYDIVVGGVFINVPRAMNMEFTTPIMYWAGVAAMVPADKVGLYQSLADLNKPSIRVAVIAGTAEYDFVKLNLPLANISPIPNDDITLALAEVAAGRADVAFTDLVTMKKYVAGKPSLAIAFGGKPFNANAAGFAVKLGDADWLQFLNNSILSLQVDGTIDALSRKYNGADIWMLPKNTWQ